MRYKVGDKVRVRGDLLVEKRYGSNIFVSEMEKYKGKVVKVAKVETELCSEYRLGNSGYHWTSEMLRPVEFKIWCETEEEKQAVLEELEKEGYVWCNSGKKPTEHIRGGNPKCGLYVKGSDLTIGYDKNYFDEDDRVELTPSEFTGIDFSHKSKKIIIEQTKTGVKATYGDKWSYVNGDFDDASRQALAEVLCPFKVGDRVKNKYKGIGEVTNIKISSDYHCAISVYHSDSNHNVKYYINELEPYTEPLYNAKLFCIKGSEAFTKGYIYEVKDGEFTDGYLTQCKPYKDLENVNETLYAQFMEVKGGLDE